MKKSSIVLAVAVALLLLGSMMVISYQPDSVSSRVATSAPSTTWSSSGSGNHRIVNMALDNTPSASSGPLIPHPSNSIVVVPVYNAFVSHNTTSNEQNNSVHFPSGNFSKITVSFFDQYISNPFDDSFVVTVNGVEVLAGNTLELENTSVTQNITEYGSIMNATSSVFVTSPQFNPGYSSALSVWFTFYNGTPPAEPNKVIPAFTNVNFPTPRNAFPNNVPIPFNVSRTSNVTFPENVTSAYLNLYEQQNGNDEFWYTLQPPYREFRVFIANTLVATVQPYPNIQTGGGDLFLWQPILAIGAEMYPPHTINLNPYLSLLKGKQNVTVEVLNDENVWIRAAANFMLTTSHNPDGQGHTSSALQFSDSYYQSPLTNATTESIPQNAAYLNDTQFVNESLTSSGVVPNGAQSIYSTTDQAVSFFANSTTFDPSFNIIQNTSFGVALVYVENFYLREYINTTTSTIVQSRAGMISQAYSMTGSTSNQYYQVNGTLIEYVVLNPFSVVLGFNVTQIRDVSTSTYSTASTSFGHTGNFHFNTTSDVVQGNGIFDAQLNSHFTITSLTYNHAVTQKTVTSHAFSSRTGSSFYYMNEKAVNDSLVNRNGTLLYRTVIKSSHGGP